MLYAKTYMWNPKIKQENRHRYREPVVSGEKGKGQSSHYFSITLNGVKYIKTVNYYAVYLNHNIRNQLYFNKTSFK